MSIVRRAVSASGGTKRCYLNHSSRGTVYKKRSGWEA
jgi:hypothetical protein